MVPASYPLVKPAIVSLIAVYLAIYFPNGSWISLCLVLIALLLLLLSKRRKSILIIRNIAWLAVFFGLMFCYTQGRFSGLNPSYENLGKSSYFVKIRSANVSGNKLKVKADFSASANDAFKGIEIFISDTADLSNLLPGNMLFMELQPKRVEAPRNPHQFNYANYLAFKGIYFQAFVKEYKGSIIKQGGFSLSRLAAKIQRKLRENYKALGLSGEVLGVSAALIFGDKSFLDEDTRQAYSTAGVMHVLAVSGLHVGIIYIIVLVLFRLRNKAHYSWKQALSLIAILWIYALITGFSPSVQRAATMFTFLCLAKSLKRNGNPVNLLAGSALFLMLCSPTIVTEIGFQMSYIAVLGILLIFPWINALVATKNKAFQALWQLAALSLAAQIATGMLSMIYFQQFPSYFLLANLIVVPLATLVVWLGAAINVFSLLFFPLAKILAAALIKLVTLLNFIVFTVESLPFSSLKNFYVNWADGVFYYLVLFALLAALYFRKKPALFLSQGLFVFWLLSCQKFPDKPSWIFPHHNYADLLVAVNNNNATIYTSGISSKSVEYLLSKDLASKGVFTLEFRELNKSGFSILSNQDNPLLIIHSEEDLISLPSKLKGKTMFFAKPIWQWACINELQPKQIIVSNRVGWGYINWLKDNGLSPEINIHLSKNDGYLAIY